MRTRHERLRHAREVVRKIPSTAEAARRIGANENTYKSHENGLKPMSWEVAEKYATKLGVDPYWLFHGFTERGIGLETTMLPLLQLYVINGKNHLPFLMEKITEKIAAVGLYEEPEQIFAVKNPDDAMVARAGSPLSFSPGEILIFDPNAKVMPGEEGVAEDVILSLERGAREPDERNDRDEREHKDEEV